MTINTRLTFLAAIAAAFTACKKDDDPAPPVGDNPTGDANISMAFTFQHNDQPWTLDSLLTDSLGHRILVTSFKFYMSGIHAENDADELVGEWPDKVLLVDAAGSNTFAIGTMGAGHIHQIHFDLGLDSVTNHGDPTVADAPLNDPFMHWSWNPAAGYKFLLIEGRVDDDGDGVVQADDPEVIYHCATDALLTEGHAHEHHDVAAGDDYQAPIIVTMDSIFTGMDVLATPSASGAEPYNIRLMSNLASAIDGMD